MSGDSVLDMLVELKKYRYVGFLYIFAVIVFFVFFFQTLYVTLVTDSYFIVVKEFAKLENLVENKED